MTILVAGASRGLGLAIASVALSEEHTVIASYRTESAELVALSKVHSDTLQTVRFDVTDEPAIMAAVASVLNAGVSLTHIVNSAGVLMGRGDRCTELRKGDLIESFETHAVGPALVVKHFLPLLVPATGIQVLNVSSQSGSMASVGPSDYAYSISKCALNMYTAMLRAELAPRGVGVAAVHPGWIRTDMGGPDAPGDPLTAAQRIIRLLSGAVAPPSAWYFDIDLNPLSL